MLSNEQKYKKDNALDKFMIEFNSFENHKNLEASREEVLEALKILETDELIGIYGQSRSNPHFKLVHSDE